MRVTSGIDKLKIFHDMKTKSGVGLDRHFCVDCGSDVFLSSANPEISKKFFIVALGTVDEEFSWGEFNKCEAVGLRLLRQNSVQPPIKKSFLNRSGIG